MPETDLQIRRKDRKNMGKQSCYVCGQHASITQVHHLVPVAILKELFRYAATHNVGLKVEYKTVALCPNHHALLHMLYDKSLLPFAIDRVEKEMLLELASLQNKTTKEAVDSSFAQLDAALAARQAAV